MTSELIEQVLQKSDDFKVRSEALMGAFVWAETRQGHKFWEAQFARLEDGKELSLGARAVLRKMIGGQGHDQS